MSLTDNIINGRGTWELFETADGYDLSKARLGHVDRSGKLWLKMPEALICTDGRHVAQVHDTNALNGFDAVVQECTGFSRSDTYWWITEEGRLFGMSLEDGVCEEHTDRLPGLQEAYWLWTTPHEDIVIGIPDKVIRYDGKTATSYDVPATDENDLEGRAHSATIAPDGTLWVSSTLGLHQYAEDGATLYENELFDAGSVWDVIVDVDGNVWNPIGGKILILHPGPERKVDCLAEDLQFHPKPHFIDDEGNLWGLSRPLGAICCTRQGCVMFPYEDTPGAQWPDCIVQDKSRSIWFVGVKNGLCRYNPNRLHPLKRMRVEATTTAPDGSIVLAAASRGIYTYKDGELTQLSPEAPYGCQDLAAKEDGTLSFGANRTGASWYSPATGKIVYAQKVGPEQVKGRRVGSCAFDPDGASWLTTKTLVVRHSETETLDFLASDLGVDALSPVVFTDSNGTVWVAGAVEDAISQFREGQMTRLTEKIGVGAGRITCFFERNDEHMWLGTSEGTVVRCERKTGTCDLLLALDPRWQINDIRIDDQGIQWISTSEGLYISNGEESYLLQETALLPSRYVLRTCELPDSRILIVTQYGACEYEVRSGQHPAIFVSAIEADKIYHHPSELTLYEGQPKIVIRLASCSMKIGPLKYQVRLHGYDDDWQDTVRHEITYENLPLGDYTFEVRAVDQDLMTSENAARVTLAVVKDPRDKAISDLQRVLRNANDFSESIIESIHEAIIVLDPEGSIVRTNKATLELLGYREEDLIGNPVELLFHEEEAHLLDAAGIAELSMSERAGSSERVLRKKDGAGLPVLLSVSRMLDDAGNLRSLVFAASDLTRYKQMHTELLQSQKLESLGVLAGGIAHDFNNMLAVILGNAELCLSRAAEGSPDRGFLTDVVDAGNQAAKLCSALLTYAGKKQTHRSALDLSQIVQQNASLLRSAISKKIDLVYDLPDALPKVMGDEVQLMQVVMNFITNAAEAIGEDGGTVYLSTSSGDFTERDLASRFTEATPPAGEYVVLEIRDTGCGMERKLVDQIFDPFFTTKPTGRGLGLSSVLGIIRAHNAALSVESEPGQGSTFRVLCPVLEDEATGETRLAEAAEEDVEEAVSHPLGGGKILIVDDEESLRTLAVNILKTLGYDAITAVDGAEGFTMLKENLGDISVVFLDITMPRMDGPEAYGHMRYLSPHLPIIICSGYSEEDISSRFIEDENLLFLHKPFNRDQVAGKVAQALMPHLSED